MTQEKTNQNLISKDLFTVGLPSYKSGPSIIQTIKMLRESEGVEPGFVINIYADGGMDPEIKKGLEPYDVNIIDGNPRVGQTAGNKKLAQITQTELYVQTQDDVIYEPQTLRLLLEAFIDDPELTMAVPSFLPLEPANTQLEKALGLGQYIRNEISWGWNEGDNYLSAIGRCLAFRTKMAQNFEIEDKVINCDAYYYFENKRLGGKYRWVKDAVLRFRVPQQMIDHLKQVRKFVVSGGELNHYFKMDLKKDYTPPVEVKMAVLLKHAFLHPILFAHYVWATIYSRTRPKEFYKEVTLFWEVDESTKQL